MIHVLVNPVAGSGHAVKVEKQVVDELKRRGIAYTLSRTLKPGHAKELAQQISAQEIQKLLCIGGDGTMYEAAQGLYGTNTALGPIPAGTGNDFAASLGIAKDPLKALDQLLMATPSTMDLGQAGEQKFLNICGVGFDVEVLRHAFVYKKRLRGMMPYFLGILRALFSYKPVEVDLLLDGKHISQRVLMMAVANGRFFGGGMCIAPEAKVNDGLLDVVIIDAISAFRVPFYLGKFLSGKILTLSFVKCHTCHEVQIRMPHFMMEVDGEVAPSGPVMFTIAQQKLWVLRPH